MAVGDTLAVTELEPEGHSTSPPARFTEASLVKALEERGIGRPSTYAAIMGTILDRGYVRKQGQALVPEFLAFAVVNLLEQHFPQLVDYEFTARMEDDLDGIAGGDESRTGWLRRFYFGTDSDGDDGLKALVELHLGDIDARQVNTVEIPRSDIVVRVGRYGPYLERGSDRQTLRARHRTRRADARAGGGAARAGQPGARARRASRDEAADRAAYGPVRART